MPARLLLAPLLLTIMIPLLHAQEQQSDQPSQLGVVIGAKGGPIWSRARGEFPSLLIGDTQIGSGPIDGDQAETQIGSRWAIELLVPFTPLVALNLEMGSLHYVAGYRGDSTTAPTRFEAQTLQVVPRLALNIISSAQAFRNGGIRTLFIAAGVDLAVATVANRVEGSAFIDSVSSVRRTGSFETSEPFRVLAAATVGIGIRIGVMEHLEVVAEAGYARAINRIFSSDVLTDNDFTLDYLSVQLGLGYRF